MQLAGHIGKEKLGLDDAAYKSVCQCDLIVHNAAQVNTLMTYEQLRTANVTATENLLKVACTGSPAVFHCTPLTVAFRMPDVRR